VVSANHIGHLGLELLVLFVLKIAETFLFDAQFNFGFFLVVDLKNVLLVVLAGPPDEDFVVRLGGFCLGNFGENERLLNFPFGVIDGIYHLL
jgi:hypothetical protein